MANIDIKLLKSKRSKQSVDGLDTKVVAVPGGYTVIEGENKATTFVVRYPEERYGEVGYAHMMNARGEYYTQEFGAITPEISFDLDSSMTYAGNTIIVFYAVKDDVKNVWSPVIVPVTATGIDYRQVAMANPDVLHEAIDKSNTALAIARDIEERANNGELGNGGSTSNYNLLANKPSINGVELTGDKTSMDLKMGLKGENIAISKYDTLLYADEETAGNVAVGNAALVRLQGYSFHNVAVGSAAFSNVKHARNCVAIGRDAGVSYALVGEDAFTEGSIFIGYGAQPRANGERNQIVIGNYLNNYKDDGELIVPRGHGSNTVTIGTADIEGTYIYGKLFLNEEEFSQTGADIETIVNEIAPLIDIKILEI